MSIYRIKYESNNAVHTTYVGATSEYRALNSLGEYLKGEWVETCDGLSARIDAFSGAHLTRENKYDYMVLTSRSGYAYKIPVEIERVNPEDVDYGTEILYYRGVWNVSTLTSVLIELLRGDESDKPCEEDAEALITFTEYTNEDLIIIKRGKIEYF